jgi:hypothetical protein
VIAHHGGAPVEELLLPLISTGGGLVVAARLVLARLHSKALRNRSKGS